MKQAELSSCLLYLLMLIPFLSNGQGACTIDRYISDIQMDSDEFEWDNDYYDEYENSYSYRHPSSLKRINFDVKIICDNITLNSEKSLQSQVTGQYQAETNKTKSIRFSNSQLNRISVSLFNNITFIQQLYLPNSNISSIEPDALNMPSLETLRLENNNITEIKNGTFRKLASVQEINLQNNHIQSIDSFKYCKNLRFLNLESNNIGEIAEDLFQNLTNLLTLNLSSNNISRIHPHAFLNLTILRTIYLEQNALKTLPDTLFIKNSHLSNLYLSNNYLRDLKFTFNVDLIPPRIYFGHSIILQLSNNNLTSIPGNMSSMSAFSVASLRIDLNNNDIKTIQSNDLTNLNRVDVLLLSHNKIDSIDVGAFKNCENLETLDLSYNKLKDLAPGMFSGLNSLYNLNLSYNELTHFDSTVFFSLTMLDKLDYRGNYLHGLNTTAIFLPKISVLHLDFYHISCHFLVQYLHALKAHGINVAKGSTFNTENINGIACDHRRKLIHSSTISSSSTESTTTTTTVSLLPNSTSSSTTTNIPEVIASSTTVKPLNLTKQTSDFVRTESKTSHAFLITCIIVLIGVIAGVTFWFGKKYYRKRIARNADESQYGLMNIHE